MKGIATLLLIDVVVVVPRTFADGSPCTPGLLDTCSVCCEANRDTAASLGYNCSLPGLDHFKAGIHEGVQVNYLSYVTETSSPNLPLRADEFTACTGGTIVFSEANNVFEDPVLDLGTKTSRGSEIYDGYFMSYSHFPEVSQLDLAEHLNDRIRKDNALLKWEDVLPKVRQMGEYRKDGVTNIDFLMYDGDFFVPLIRLDLLEKHNLPLPNTWDEVLEYAKFFNGTDLNGDGNADDFGFCHFPRDGAGFWDWWWPEAMYSIWATMDQTRGTDQGFFFDEETLEPRIGPGFERASKIWKDLWNHGADGCITQNFATGRCAIGFAPPGCWKGIFLNGISRRDVNGTLLWEPKMEDGSYATPYRFKPYGSLEVVDRGTNELVPCTKKLCPKAEPIPARGHWGDNDRASILPPTDLEGKLVNRAPYYWSGGLGTLIRKSSPQVKKDMMWDFFVYTNAPETSAYDVASYASWLDSWRKSQLESKEIFVNSGWSPDAYYEHRNVMQWALAKDSNGAYNLRLPSSAKYTRDVLGNSMNKYTAGKIEIDELLEEVKFGWQEIIEEKQNKLDLLEMYRSSLGLDALSEVEMCRLHRRLMDDRNPNTCVKYDLTVDKNQLGPGIRAYGFTTAGITLVTSFAFGAWTFFHRNSRVVRASQPIFLFFICVGTFIFGSAIIPISIDDGIASEETCSRACMSIPWLVALGWSILFAALFAKLRRVNLVMQNAVRFKRLKVEERDVMLPFVVLFTANLIVLIVWTATDPLYWERTMINETSSYGHCWIDLDSVAWKVCVPLLGLLNGAALVLANGEAYKARNVSTEFSESKYIALANASMLQVLLISIPLIFLVADNPTATFFVISSIVLILCMSVLLLMFLPKIFNFYQARRDKDEISTSSSVTISGLQFQVSKVENEELKRRLKLQDENLVNLKKLLCEMGINETVFKEAGFCDMRDLYGSHRETQSLSNHNDFSILDRGSVSEKPLESKANSEANIEPSSQEDDAGKSSVDVWTSRCD